MSGMDEPPFLLDAALVLEYAAVDAGSLRHGFNIVVNGVPLDAANVSRVAIVRALLDDRHFILHCNEDWETVAAADAKDVAAAREEAQAGYGGSLGPWQPYRELSAEERREAATTRDFLRSLAAES